MKRGHGMTKSRIAIWTLTLAAAMPLMADTWTDPDTGYTWTYRINGDTAEICNNYSAAVSPSPEDAVTIPCVLGDKPVTSIGSYAFSGCGGLTSVTIPDGVTSIGERAFEYCRSLQSVTIPNTVRNIGGGAFDGCYNLKRVNISDLAAWCAISYDTSGAPPDSLASLSSSPVFWASEGLFVNGERLSGELVIPNGVSSIGAYAFTSARGFTFTSVTIPDSVTSIGDYAFAGCTGLTSVTIPDGVTSIGSYAFYCCTNLTSIVFPSTVTNIAYGAISRCSNLYSITVPQSLLSNMSRLSQALDYDSRIADIVIAEGTTNIPPFAFDGYWELRSVTIPSSVKIIADYAFYRCSDLTNITIACGVTNIGYYAFSGCRELLDVTIPESVTSIGERAFEDCRSLQSVTIPNSVKDIGSRAFYGCYNLRRVNIFDLAAWCTISFGTSGANSYYDQYSNPLCYAYGGLYLNGELLSGELVIPDNVASICAYAFAGCSGLTSVTIPDSVTDIGSYAFAGCSGLTSFAIPNTVTNIAYSAFSGCADLRSITVPQCLLSDRSLLSQVIDSNSRYSITNVVIDEGVTNVPQHAFRNGNWHNLTSVTIPASVRSIGSYAFDFIALSEIHVLASIADWCSISFGPSWHGFGIRTTIQFDDISTQDSLEVPEGVENIGAYAFYGFRNIKNVTIPRSLKTVGTDAFNSAIASVHIEDLPAWCRIAFANFSANPLYSEGTLYLNGEPLSGELVLPDDLTAIAPAAFCNCRNLTSVRIPNSVTNIGAYAFLRCSGLTSVTVSDPNCAIGDGAFIDCFGLADNDGFTVFRGVLYDYSGNATDVVVPDNVHKISRRAFSGCTNMQHVALHDGITAIGSSAFYNCSGLTSITIPDSIASIGSSAFYNCSNLTSAVIGNGVTNIGSSAFYNCSGLTSVTIPDSVTSIGYDAFRNCSGLTSVTIPDSVTSIGSSAFGYCDNIKCVTIPQCVCNSRLSSVFNGGTVITSYSDGTVVTNYHSGCQSIETVVISAGVTNIGSDVFSGCTNLASVMIPSSVANIGTYAFLQCDNLSSLVFEGNAPRVSDWTFSNIGSNCTAYVNPGSTGWGVEILGTWNGVRIEYRADGTLNGEFVNAGGMNFTTTGDAPWAGQTAVAHDGIAALRSGAVSDGESSRLECTVSGAGELRFWWKVSSEEPFGGVPLDLVSFSVDGARKEWIAGETDWTNAVVSVEGEGQHVLAWVYQKDDCEDTSAGEDCAWLDEVTWIPARVPVDMGGDKSITVPGTWIAEHENLVRNNGGNVSTALRATAANGRLSVAECYVVGVDPESTTNDFKITSFPMKADGTPDLENIVFDPPEARWNVEGARPVVKGAARLDGEWQAVTEENKAGFRFFKVEVVLP